MGFLNLGGFDVNASASQSFGGFIPVWMAQEDIGVLPGGGQLAAEYLVASTIIPAGTPIYQASIGGVQIPLEVFELTADVSTADTNITIKKGNLGTVPTSSHIFMVSPASGITGKAAVNTAVAINASGYYDVSISANAIGAATAGDYLVFGASANAAAIMKAPANGLLLHDCVIGTGAIAAHLTVVWDGEVLEDRIPTVPANIKALLPNIKFIKEL
jgi:hypothetical protein